MSVPQLYWSFSHCHDALDDIAGSHTGAEEKLVTGEIDFVGFGAVKVWVDAAEHY